MLVLMLMISSAAVATGPTCNAVGPTRFDRIADLPSGVMSELDMPMADKGQDYQSGDTVAEGHPLPLYRFVNAYQQGCSLLVNYEHGGRGHGLGVVRFEMSTTGWQRVSQHLGRQPDR